MKQAILLAAGFGSRLGDITQNTPKCLVPIGDTNMLDFWLRKLAESGVEEIFVNTHYKAKTIEAYLKTHPLNELVTIFHESEILGTAKTMLALRERLKGDFFFIHADNYTSADLTAMKDAHIAMASDKIGTVLVFNTDDCSSCGIFSLDELGNPIGYVEKPEASDSPFANGAVFTFKFDIFDILSEKQEAEDFCADILPLCFKKLKVVMCQSYHIDVGTPDNLSAARALQMQK